MKDFTQILPIYIDILLIFLIFNCLIEGNELMINNITVWALGESLDEDRTFEEYGIDDETEIELQLEEN